MISFDEAVALVCAKAKGLEPQQVALADAEGRFLAEDVRAALTQPQSAVSAMDGYAVRDDAAAGDQLRVVGESFAGQRFTGSFSAGECVRIFTGAPVPEGAARVVIQENVTREGDVAQLNQLGDGRNIRTAGSDFAKGDVLVAAGARLSSRAMVAAAAADHAEIVVWRQPRIAILATGDELTAPGDPARRDDQIPESVSHGIAAMVHESGAKVVHRARIGDDPGALEMAAKEAVENADLVIVTGGASVGERDYAKAMFAPFNLDLLFSKVAIKPGKPVWLGHADAGAGSRLVMGLPGNPTSALVTARLFLVPLITGLCGGNPASALAWRKAALAAPLPATGGRETFARGTLGDAGVTPVSNQESGAQQALVLADRLIRCRPNSPAQEAGSDVDVLNF